MRAHPPWLRSQAGLDKRRHRRASARARGQLAGESSRAKEGGGPSLARGNPGGNAGAIQATTKSDRRANTNPGSTLAKMASYPRIQESKVKAQGPNSPVFGIDFLSRKFVRGVPPVAEKGGSDMLQTNSGPGLGDALPSVLVASRPAEVAHARRTRGARNADRKVVAVRQEVFGAEERQPDHPRGGGQGRG